MFCQYFVFHCLALKILKCFILKITTKPCLTAPWLIIGLGGACVATYTWWIDLALVPASFLSRHTHAIIRPRLTPITMGSATFINQLDSPPTMINCQVLVLSLIMMMHPVSR